MAVITEKILDILFPRRCLRCGLMLKINSKDKWFCERCKPYDFAESSSSLCEKCGRIINHIGRCEMCNQSTTYYDGGYVVFKYENEFRQAFIRYKFKGVTMYADYFAEMMTEYYYKCINKHYDYICCVPMYKKKKVKRGYNQSELIARKIAKNVDLRYEDLLIKIKDTKRQSSLNAKLRADNIKNAFKSKTNLNGKSILIIDDIITTGHTINECSKVLKKAGAANVDFFIVADRSQSDK